MATEVKDLSNYHRVLKQFLDISSDNLTPVTSSRVIKAREKLCRLTPSQFYDLSTDVYDELQRRINETNSKPEFLLPKAKFHPKRNQARQKLASLPSPRFKDLVNDVLYEIERRDYRIVGYDINESQNFGRKKSSSSSKKENHEIIDNKENELNNRKISVNNIKQQNVQEHQPFKDDPYSENINKNRLSTNDVSINPDSNSIDNNQTPSKSEIKPSTVFPKKSELTWSSDEEDEGDEHKVVSNLPKLSAYETPEPVIPISTTQNGLQSKSLKPHNSTDTNDGVSTAIAGATSISQNDANNRSIDYDTSPLPKRESRRSSTKSKELKLLMEESAKMDQTITDLENELKSVNQKNRSLDDENENYQNEISNLNLQLENFKNLNNDYKELDNENLILKQKIEELDNENLILKQKIEELNQFKLENSEKFENYDSINNNYITLNENFKSLSSENSKLLETNNSLKQEIEKLKLSLQESNSKNIDTNNDDKGVNVITNPIQEKSKVDDILPEMAESNEALSSQLGDLKQQANEYKQRYEALRSNQIFELLNDKLPKLKDIDLLADDTGLIPLQLVANLYSSVESLLIYINGSDINVNSLFDLMASVISSAHSIVSEVKNDTSSSYLSGNSSNISSPKTPIDDNDLNSVTLYRCKAIESSISNSLTCTRYFAIYKDFVPKLSLEVSVNDIYFSVCELINIVKVNHNKIPKMRFKNSPLLQQINDANISGNRSLVGEGLLNTEDTAIKTESNALNPEINAIKNGDNLDQYNEAPVIRPFKMAQKLNNSSGNLTANEQTNALQAPLIYPKTRSRIITPPIAPIQVTNHSSAASTATSTTANKLQKPVSSIGTPSPSTVNPMAKGINSNGATIEEEDVLITPPASSSILNTIGSSTQRSINPNGELQMIHNGAIKNKEITAQRELELKQKQAAQDQQEAKEAKEKIAKKEGEKKAREAIEEKKIKEAEEEEERIRTKKAKEEEEERIRIQKAKEEEEEKNRIEKAREVEERKQKELRLQEQKAKEQKEEEQKRIQKAKEEEKLKVKQAAEALRLKGEQEKLEREERDFKEKSAENNEDENFNSSNRSKPEISPLMKSHSIRSKRLDAKSSSEDTTANTMTPDLNAEYNTTSPLKIKNPLDDSPIEPINKFASSEAASNDAQDELYEDAEEYEAAPTQNLNSEHAKKQVESSDVSSVKKSKEVLQRKDSYDQYNNDDYYDEDDEEEEEDDFDFENFNTLNPDNTLKELLLYLEHQTVQVISAIQTLLESIRDSKATRGLLRSGATEIITVVKQMAEGTTTLMNQSRYAESMGHARYVVDSLEDCVSRMEALYNAETDKTDNNYADKSFKQRSAGIAFDVARSTKELVKTVEEASIKDEIAVIDARLNY